MTIGTVFARINRRTTEWLLAPEPNAAGRMGLFRILYASFYLWYLATTPVETISRYWAVDYNVKVDLVELLPTLTPVALQLIQAGLVAALVLLALGYRTPIVTGVVLVLGVVLDAVSFTMDGEHATVLLTAFIPLLMLVAGRWGDTYSLDALRMRAQGKRVASPRDESGRYFLGARAIFVVLALLFTSAGISKLLPSSTWLTHPDLVANLVLEKNVAGVLNGLPANPAAGWISQTPVLHESMRFGIVIFELSFLVALFSATLRQLVIAAALVFHSFNALVLGITFTPVLIAYAPFVDWQGLLDRGFPRRPRLRAPAGTVLAWTALIAAGAAASLWYANDALEEVITLGGVLDWRTIFYVVLPLALVWLLVQLVSIGKSLRRAMTGRLRIGTPR